MLQFQGPQGYSIENDAYSRFSRSPNLTSRFSRSGSHPGYRGTFQKF